MLEQTASGPLVELPLGSIPGDAAAMYRGMFHERPVVNGYSGFVAPFYPLLEFTLAVSPAEAAKALASLGVTTVAVRRADDDGGGIAARFAEIPGVQRAAGDDRVTMFRLPSDQSGQPGESPRGARLPIASLVASEHPENAGRALDGNRETRWDTGGRQQPGATLTLDLGAAQPVGAVVIELGPSVHDFPRILAVEISADGLTWSETFHGPIASPAVMAAVRHPLTVPLDFPLGGGTARFVRLTQLGEDQTFYWSVAELGVYGPSVH